MDKKNSKENYMPASILPNFSNIYERCLFSQMFSYFEKVFCKYQCGLRQCLSVHYCLISALREKCPNTEFFWSVFSYIRTEYGDLRSKSPYSVRIQKNTDQKKLHILTLFTQWEVMLTLNQETKSLFIV